MPRETISGFTLIELSIVLVIIGLIVGGVLAGQSLIIAAGVRAQISQIERYNTAANTFRGKYGYLPGDIPAGPAAQFGLASRGQYAGEGDGNNVIEGVTANAANSNTGFVQMAGETAMFWVDLSSVNMIPDGLNYASSTNLPFPELYLTTTPGISSFMPSAKLGSNNFVYVWSVNGENYYGLSAITAIGGGTFSNPGISVAQAYAIDKKTDDGLPGSGGTTAQYLYGADGGVGWSAGYPYVDTYTPISASPNAAVAGSSTTCMDNNNTTGTEFTYSLEQNNGNGINCGLSFKMQAGD